MDAQLSAAIRLQPEQKPVDRISFTGFEIRSQTKWKFLF